MKNVPNVLTSIRFFLIFVFVWVFYSNSINHNVQWSIAVFMLAGITDVLDGYIARKYDAVSDFGKLMDPLADKLMMITALICLYTKEYIPLFIIIIVLIKDLLLVIGGVFMYRRHDYAVSSNKFGKITAVFLNLSLVLIAFEIPYAKYLLLFSVFFGIIALAQYALLSYKRSRKV